MEVSAAGGARQEWTEFLDSLEASCLRVEDPQTRLRGHIPLRGGVWFSNVIVCPGARAALPSQIKEVHGNLMLRGNRPATRHMVVVRGAVYLETAQLMLDAFVASLHGPLRLYSETERTAEDLDAPARDPAGLGLAPRLAGLSERTRRLPHARAGHPGRRRPRPG